MDHNEYVRRYAEHFYKTFRGEMPMVECLEHAEIGAKCREDENEPFATPEDDASDELACWD